MNFDLKLLFSCEYDTGTPNPKNIPQICVLKKESSCTELNQDNSFSVFICITALFPTCYNVG